MKKGFKAVTAAALAISALTPVAAFAAENTVENGVYTTTNFYSLDAFKKLSGSAKAAALTSEGAVIVVAGKVYTGANVISLNDTQLEASAVTVDAYNAANDNKLVSGKPIGEGTQTGDLKVETVSAINANEILLTFNKELDKTDAETEARYTINSQALAGVDTATLQSDKKSVIIKFDTLGAGVLAAAGGAGKVQTTTNGFLDNNTAYTVNVSASLKTADGKTLGTAASKGIFFADSVKPSVSSLKLLENGDLQVKFSERYSAPVTARVYVDGIQVNTGGESLTDDSYNGYYTIPKNNITTAFTNAGKTFEAGKTYPVIVSGFVDFVGNVQNLYNGSITNTVANDAPTVQSVVAKNETTLEVTFSEEILNATKDGVTDNAAAIGLAANGITKNNVPLAASTATTTDGKKFSINLPTAANAIYDGSKNETSANLVVKLNGFKDLAGNVGVTTEKSVTVTKDTVKPSVTKAEYTYVSAAVGDDTLVVTISELTTAKTAANLAAAGMYITDSNGVRYEVSAPSAISDALAGDATDKTFTILVDDASLALTNGDYVLHIPANTFNDQGVNNGNGNAAQTVNFKVTGAAADTTKPTAAVTPGANNGQITVTYSETVKGGSVTGSATDLANYKLNGAALPAGTTITLDATRQIATITLPNGAIEASGARSLQISGVQDVAGNVIVTDIQAVALTENKKPELTGAKVVNGELVLTFSENVDHITAGSATAFAAADFEVQVNGVDVTEQLEARAAADAKNVLRLTATDASFATGAITVKVLDAATATDAAGNAVVKGTLLTATR